MDIWNLVSYKDYMFPVCEKYVAAIRYHMDNVNFKYKEVEFETMINYRVERDVLLLNNCREDHDPRVPLLE
jgi:hypothetical protein